MSLRALIMGSSGGYVPDTAVRDFYKLSYASGSRLWKGMAYGKFEHLTNSDGSPMYPNGVFATVAYGTAKAAYSLDNAQTFTEVPIPNNPPTVSNPYGGAYWNSIACGKRNGVDAFIAIIYVPTSSAAGNKAAWSADGITWTYFTLPVTGFWYSIHYQGGNWFILGTTTALVSTDGITWTTITGLRSATTWKGCVYVKRPDGTETVVITGNAASAGAVQVLIKTGSQWVPQTPALWNSATGGAMRLSTCATDGNGKIIVGGLDLTMGLISTDYGQTFNMLQLPLYGSANQPYEVLLYGDGVWMCVGTSIVGHSSSGEAGKWGIYKPAGSSIGTGYGGVYANGRFVIGGNSAISTVTF